MWVVLVVDILNKDYDAGDVRNLNKKIDQLPGDLFSLFRDILTRDTKNPKALLLCIQWILFANQPLTPIQLYLAILSGLEPESLPDCRSDDYKDEEADAQRYILDKSKGLVESTKSKSPTVQFIHESVNDFLRKENGLAWLFPDLADQIEGHSHDALKACCLAYTNFVADFSGGEYYQKMSRQEATKAFELLEYANSGLLYHADQAGNYGIDQHGFLTTFPRSEWVRQHNLLQKFRIRHYKPEVSLLYILAEAGLSTLIRAHSSRQSCFEIEADRHGIPILAASAKKHGSAVLVMLELEADRVPDFDFRKFYSRLPPGMDQLSASSMSFQFQIKRGGLYHLIVYGSDLAALFYIVTEETYLDSVDKQQDDLMEVALKYNKPETAKLLSGCSSNTRKTWPGRQYPLHYASSHGNTELVKLLLACGREIMPTDHRGATPLHLASSFDVAKLLIDRGSDIEASDCYGYTPLHAAAAKGLAAVAKILIDRDASVSAINGDRQTPLHIANQDESAAAARLFIESRASVSATDKHGRTPLHVACLRNSVAVAGLLIDSGASVLATDTYGRTPLHCACSVGTGGMTQLLIESGADILAHDESGNTPLHLATRSGLDKEDEVNLLIDCGANVSATNKAGETPLQNMMAGYLPSGSEKSARLLINNGADVLATDQNGRTLLLSLTRSMYGNMNSLEMPRILINSGVNVNAADKDGKTPLLWAVSKNYFELAKLLLECGADASTADDNGDTPLILASIYGWFKIVESLLKHGADVSAANKEGITALQIALRWEKVAIANLLRERGADL